MTIAPLFPAAGASPLDVGPYLDWAREHGDERTELLDGEIVPMSPETNLHSEVKASVCAALYSALRRVGGSCRVYVDGSGIAVGERTVFVPDVVVQCTPADPRAMTLAEPVVVVEIISPSSRGIDTNRKLLGYFRLPSLAHYLVVDPVDRTVIVFRRDETGSIRSEVVTADAIDLDPPGVALLVADLFPG